MSEARTAMTDGDYVLEMSIDASPEAVYAAVTTTEGLASWWTPVTGNGHEGGELRFDMGSPDGPLVVTVRAAAHPHVVVWDVAACPFLTEWEHTRIVFDIGHGGKDQTAVFFRHHGLSPALECYDMCLSGWNHFLASLAAYAASGEGQPRGSAGDQARRRIDAAKQASRMQQPAGVAR